jgi:non-specific serine/threonine protein kinase
MSLDEAIAYALAGDADRPLPGGPKGSAEPSPLTAREREVAALVAEGFSNRAIADALVIAPRTVETHVSNILGKLDLHSRAQIAAWAVEHGLVASRHPRSATTETT